MLVCGALYVKFTFSLRRASFILDLWKVICFFWAKESDYVIAMMPFELCSDLDMCVCVCALRNQNHEAYTAQFVFFSQI